MSCSAANTTSVEAFLPTERLMESVVVNFDLKSEDFKRKVMSLTSFMQHVGMSKNTSCNNLRVSGAFESSSPDVLNSNHNHKEAYFPSISNLLPLVIKLDKSKHFRCLLSVVSKDMFVYVHPVELSVAHNMITMEETLLDHYNVAENRVAMSCEHLKCGKLCVVYSSGIQKWCRGVVVVIQSDLSSGDDSNCLIFYLDYGGHDWVKSSQLCALTHELGEYPAQVVCLDLIGSTERGRPRVNPEMAIKRFVSREELEEPATKCISSVAEAIENRILVADVVEGKYFKIRYSIIH